MTVLLDQFNPAQHMLRIIDEGAIQRVTVEKRGFCNNRFFRWLRQLFGNKAYDIAAIATTLSKTSPPTANRVVYERLKATVEQKWNSPQQSAKARAFLRKILDIAPPPQNLPPLPAAAEPGVSRLQVGNKLHRDLMALVTYFETAIGGENNTAFFSYAEDYYRVRYGNGQLSIRREYTPSVFGDHTEWHLMLYEQSTTIDLKGLREGRQVNLTGLPTNEPMALFIAATQAFRTNSFSYTTVT